MSRTLLATVISLITIFISHAEELRINHMQVIGTHNSYHLRPAEPLWSQLKERAPQAAASWDYSHRPLNEQLDYGVRSFELDTYVDPDGFRVLHVPQFDANSNCETFVECLEVMKSWSDANPSHVPIIVLVQVKDEQISMVTEPILEATHEALDQMDEELLSVFPLGRLIRPDDVRGNHSTLREAILTDGWPLLSESRGKFLFALHENVEILDRYADGRPSLEGRPMFVTSSEERPDASVLVVNNPYSEDIERLVKAGFIVRTRADSGIRDAAANNTERRDKAFAGVAHVLTTDFPHGSPHPESGYVVAFPDLVAVRCNSAFELPDCSPNVWEPELSVTR